MNRDLENVFSEKRLEEKIMSSVGRRKVSSNILKVTIKEEVACCFL